MQGYVDVYRPPQWAQEMQVNHDQPFYGVLPDEHDCTRLFHGARISKYVAQVTFIPAHAPLPPLGPGPTSQLQVELLHSTLSQSQLWFRFI